LATSFQLVRLVGCDL